MCFLTWKFYTLQGNKQKKSDEVDTKTKNNPNGPSRGKTAIAIKILKLWEVLIHRNIPKKC